MIKSGVVKNVFTEEDFRFLKEYFLNNEVVKSLGYDDHGRKLIHSGQDNVLIKYSEKLLPLVRAYFENDSILHTYSMYAEYSHQTIDLHKHKDLNACQYTVDIVVHQTEPWSIWVEGTEYSLDENEAVLFCGEEQEHWRETKEFNSDVIGVIFFHYADPDHWFFTEGPEYVEVVRQKAREKAMGLNA